MPGLGVGKETGQWLSHRKRKKEGGEPLGEDNTTLYKSAGFEPGREK